MTRTLVLELGAGEEEALKCALDYYAKYIRKQQTHALSETW